MAGEILSMDYIAAVLDVSVQRLAQQCRRGMPHWRVERHDHRHASLYGRLEDVKRWLERTRKELER